MILYQGLLRSTASWARVGRGYLKALIELNARGEIDLPLAAVASRGFRYDSEFPLPDGLELRRAAEVARAAPPEIGLGFVHPPDVNRLVGKRRANLFVWESDRVPSEWIEPLATLDAVIVPSDFVRRALVASGLAAECAIVVPYGHDIPSFGGAAPSRDDASFRFLSIAAPHFRKGVTELARAYRAAFRATDPVVLTIKSAYDPARTRKRRPFEIPGWERILEDAGLRAPGAPRVELSIGECTDDAIPSLYAGADVIVAPSWGEGFGLVMLEGLASGKPVIATAWGGSEEFLPPGDDLLPYRLEPAGDRLYAATPEARVARPDTRALTERMRWHFDHREESRECGKRGLRAAAPWTWERAARRLLEALAGLGPRNLNPR